MALDFASVMFDDDKDVNQIISAFLVETMASFDKKVDDIFLSTLDVPYATQLAMLKIQKIVDLAIMEHDGVHSSEEEQLEVFVPDFEPTPSVIDSWARGTGGQYYISFF